VVLTVGIGLARGVVVVRRVAVAVKICCASISRAISVTVVRLCIVVRSTLLMLLRVLWVLLWLGGDDKRIGLGVTKRGSHGQSERSVIKYEKNLYTRVREERNEASMVDGGSERLVFEGCKDETRRDETR
jgi:hypothetical protein